MEHKKGEKERRKGGTFVFCWRLCIFNKIGRHKKTGWPSHTEDAKGLHLFISAEMCPVSLTSHFVSSNPQQTQHLQF